MPQVTLYLSDANKAALDEVLKMTGGRISPVARELFLRALRIERQRLGLADLDLTQPTKHKSDAALLGIPTRQDVERGISRLPAPPPRIRRDDIEPLHKPAIADE